MNIVIFFMAGKDSFFHNHLNFFECFHHWSQSHHQTILAIYIYYKFIAFILRSNNDCGRSTVTYTFKGTYIIGIKNINICIDIAAYWPYTFLSRRV